MSGWKRTVVAVAVVESVFPVAVLLASSLISHKAFLKSRCRSQLLHKSDNVSSTITNIKNSLTDMCGNRLLLNDFRNTLCEMIISGLKSVVTHRCSSCRCGKRIPRRRASGSAPICLRALGVRTGSSYPEYSRADFYPWSPFPPRQARPRPDPHPPLSLSKYWGVAVNSRRSGVSPAPART